MHLLQLPRRKPREALPRRCLSWRQREVVLTPSTPGRTYNTVSCAFPRCRLSCVKRRLKRAGGRVAGRFRSQKIPSVTSTSQSMDRHLRLIQQRASPMDPLHPRSTDRPTSPTESSLVSGSYPVSNHFLQPPTSHLQRCPLRPTACSHAGRRHR